MGFLGTLIFKRRVRIGVNANLEIIPTAAVELDASIDETHRFSVERTQFPVEVGANISDHVRRQHDVVTIRGMVTDHPLQFGGAFGSGRAVESLNKFLIMLDKAQTVSLVTSLKEYKDMIIENMEVPRDFSRSSAIEYVLTLSQILTAQVAVTASTTDLGTQNTSTVS